MHPTMLLFNSNCWVKYTLNWTVSSLIFQKISDERQPLPRPPIFLELHTHFGLHPQFPCVLPHLFGLRFQFLQGEHGLAPTNSILRSASVWHLSLFGKLGYGGFKCVPTVSSVCISLETWFRVISCLESGYLNNSFLLPILLLPSVL